MGADDSEKQATRDWAAQKVRGALVLGWRHAGTKESQAYEEWRLAKNRTTELRRDIAKLRREEAWLKLVLWNVEHDRPETEVRAGE